MIFWFVVWIGSEQIFALPGVYLSESVLSAIRSEPYRSVAKDFPESDQITIRSGLGSTRRKTDKWATQQLTGSTHRTQHFSTVQIQTLPHASSGTRGGACPALVPQFAVHSRVAVLITIWQRLLLKPLPLIV